MNKLKSFLEQWGLHAFLLPIFFIVHNYQQYYGLVHINTAIRVGLFILLIAILFFVIIFAFTKQVNKSLQLVTLFGFTTLFFGVIKDFLQFSLGAGSVSRYSVLLPTLGIIIILLSWLILKKKNFKKNNLFQNTLLLVFLFIDFTRLIVFDHSTFLNKNILTKDDSSKLSDIPVNRNNPDIYYLVFDSYPGTLFLNKFMGFDNSEFNQKMEGKGFYVVKNPRSNYNRTAFSMASCLNFAYLDKIRPYKKVTAKDYAEANLTIKEAIVPKVFERQKYSFYNLSVFDIGQQHAIRKETFLTMPEKNILLYNTLPERLRNDLLWNLLIGKYTIPIVQKLFTETKDEFQNNHHQKKFFNNRILDSLMNIPAHQTTSPKFVYAHFYLPHPPFFYDENGNENDLAYIMTDGSLKNKELFLSYLKYTNKTIEKIIDKIGISSDNKSVIVVQSDHGFRDYTDGPTDTPWFFTNYSAFYFPDKDYSALYDTLSNVNTFPLLFNKYFNTKLPLKRDSSVFVAN